jgi:hypothetical protein
VVEFDLMGVLYDYFRAADAAAVVGLMQVSKGGSPVTERLADGYLRAVLTDLVGLARRAVTTSDDLCCWMCL